MSHKKKLIFAIDEALPQTQCGLCGYGACLPYATAIVEQGERIDRCPPGGEDTLQAVAELLKINSTPFLHSIRSRQKILVRAEIIEAQCIGCTKCIAACPVDAIVGSAKKMHTVIAAECTGCELCIPPCPMDCITLIPVETPPKAQRVEKAAIARQRYQQRNVRLAENKLSIKKIPTKQERRDYVSEAINRAKEKRKKNRS